MLEFLEVFYLATTVFSNIYTPSGHIALYNFFEIIVCFVKYRIHTELGPIIVHKMKSKF